MHTNDETRRTTSFVRIAMALVALGASLAVSAPACSSSSSGGGDSTCNEDDVCDDVEDCDCADCAGTSFCDTGTGGSTSASTSDAATGTTAATTSATGSTTSATTGSTTAATSTSAVTSSTSSGGAFMCADVSDTSVCPASDPAGCLCLGCELAACDDGQGNYNDCVCANCAADPFCSDVTNCTDDGVCDPGLEGCVCADCVGHPLCG